jgi:hypothetical protein
MRTLLVGLVFAFPVHARVLDLHSEIRISKNGELMVTERITLEAGEKSAALERRLPREARVRDVIRNGHPEKFVLDGERLRLGPAVVPEGRHLYQVTYRAARRIVFLGDHDALHWNLEGGERMTAEIILPATVPARQMKTEASGADYQSLVRDGRAAFRSEAPIALVVRFPKGAVTEPGIATRAHWLFSDYFGALLILALLVFTASVLYLIRGQGAKA